jgi:hypothetical protein
MRGFREGLWMKTGKRIKNEAFAAIANFRLPTPWVLLILLTTISASFVYSAENEFLAGKHTKIGIECQGCHQESPPGKPVLPSACLACHGDYTKIAAQTEKVNPNPHASHEGNLACSVCHNAHKPSKDHCATCHNFGFKVP